MNSKLVLRSAVFVAIAVVASGCFGGGSQGSREPAYKGEYKEYDLYLWWLSPGDNSGTRGWELYQGTKVDAWAFSPENDKDLATVPGPTIRAREGDTVRINFYNFAPMAHTIHWHGLHVPWDQDGVPYVSQLPIGDTNFGGNGENSVSYEFKLSQSGTYWYHCHVDTAHHLDMGMYGAFIVEPADPSADPAYDVEAVLMLDEWDRSHAHQNTAALTNALSRSGDPRVTANDLYGYIRDYLLMNEVYNDTVAGNAIAQQTGLVRENRSWYPVTYAPYFAEYDTFLINGKAFPDTQSILAKTGQTVRLRFINAGSQVHLMHLHGHHMLVTHTDGFKLASPYYKDTILIGPGERYDAYVELDNPGPWMLHDHIPLNEANDYINPGGMMTALCYEDGWPGAGTCKLGHAAVHGGGEFTSGDVLDAAYHYLRQQQAAQRLQG